MCYCAIKIYLSSFSILKIAVPRHKIVENYKALGDNMHHCVKFHENQSIGCRYIAI